jgi:hypothetical protein
MIPLTPPPRGFPRAVRDNFFVAYIHLYSTSVLSLRRARSLAHAILPPRPCKFPRAVCNFFFILMIYKSSSQYRQPPCVQIGTSESLFCCHIHPLIYSSLVLEVTTSSHDTTNPPSPQIPLRSMILVSPSFSSFTFYIHHLIPHSTLDVDTCSGW